MRFAELEGQPVIREPVPTDQDETVGSPPLRGVLARSDLAT
jgi:hypothetical protein